MNLGGMMKVAALGAAIARGQIKAAVRRAVQQAAFAVVVGIFGVFAFSFGLAAFTVWLSRRIGTIDALWSVALGFLVLAVIAYIVGRLVAGSRRPPRRRAEPPSSLAAALDEAQRATGTPREPPTGSNLSSLAVVALVGYLMARQMFRR